MADDNLTRKLYRAALVATFLLLALFAVRQIGSHDLGFHLKAGASILAGEGWPRTDAFTFTVRDHAYVDTSWGFQVVAHAVERLGGATGLTLWQVVTALALLFVVYRTTRLQPTDPLTAALLLLLAVIAVEIRIDVRPEWLSYLLLAATLHVLARHARGLRSPLWLLPVIQLLWVNVHGLFVVGWGAMACYVAGGWLSTRRPDRRLLGWCAAALPITLLNPYTYQALLFPLTLITRLDESNVFASAIGELFSLLDVGDLPFYPRGAIWAARLLLLLLVPAAIAHLRARRFTELLLALAFAPLALQAVRNVPLLIVACLPGLILALALSPILDRLATRPERRRALRAAILSLLLACTVILGARVLLDGYYIADRRQVRFGASWNERMLPVQAAEWLAVAQPRGRMLNSLGFGGYLMWRLDRPVFIDGRLEVMGEDFFREYNAALSSPSALDSAAARHGVDWLILRYRSHPSLVHGLTRVPGWRLVYVDAQAAIYVRGTASGILPHASVRAPPPAGLPVADLPRPGGGSVSRWLRGLVRRQSFPTHDYQLGQFHYFRAEMDTAAGYFGRAIRDSGGAFPELYNNLGASLLFQGRRDDARRVFRMLLDADPGNAYAAQKLAELDRRAPR